MNVSHTPSCMIFTVVAANLPVRRALPKFEQVVDLVLAALAVPPERTHDARGEVAVAGGAEVRGVVVHPEVRGHDRVLPGRDPEGVQVPLTLEQSLVHLVRRRFRCETADELCGALVQAFRWAHRPSSRSIRPSAGSGVSAVTPAISSARLFTHVL